VSRIDVVIRGAGVVVVAGVLAAGGAYVVNEGGGGSTANIWVDSDGGTCVDNPGLVEYATETACTLDAANDTCEAGDTVRAKGGSYGAQVITGGNGRAATCVIPEVSGESVILASLRSATTNETADGAQHLRMEGFEVTAPDLWIGGDTSNLELRDFDAPNYNVFGALQTKSNITIKGGDWGPCLADDVASNCNVKLDGTISNFVIDGGLYHNIQCSGHDCTDCTDGTPACDIHLEAIIVFAGTTGLTIRNAKFYDNEFYNIFTGQSGCGGIVGGEGSDGCPDNTPIDDVLIENNWFGAPSNGAGGAYTRTSAVGFKPSGGVPYTDMLLRFNSFAGNTGISWNDAGTSVTYTNVRGTGNLVGDRNCYASVTYQYNVYDGALTCSGTGEVALSAAFPYLDGDSDSTFNYALNGTTSIDNLVPTSVTDGCPATDLEGTVRPQGSNCDAGADER
jgi:hypothetical protein